MTLEEYRKKLNEMTEKVDALLKEIAAFKTMVQTAKVRKGDFLMLDGDWVVCEVPSWLTKEQFAARPEPILGNIYDIAEGMSEADRTETKQVDSVSGKNSISANKFKKSDDIEVHIQSGVAGKTSMILSR
ncbi:MAG: hypothetical protein PHQ00_07680, partial [Phycisphaerae bacterium]|nr:hypothetical protein [Phycisphaerae bacterium]